MIFVDTGAWFASVVPSDADHSVASTWLNQNSEVLVTTDYVIDETLTLLRIRRERQRAIALGNAFFSGALATVHYVTEAEIQQSWQVFCQFSTRIGALPTALAKL